MSEPNDNPTSSPTNRKKKVLIRDVPDHQQLVLLFLHEKGPVSGQDATADMRVVLTELQALGWADHRRESDAWTLTPAGALIADRVRGPLPLKTKTGRMLFQMVVEDGESTRTWAAKVWTRFTEEMLLLGYLELVPGTRRGGLLAVRVTARGEAEYRGGCDPRDELPPSMDGSLIPLLGILFEKLPRWELDMFRQLLVHYPVPAQVTSLVGMARTEAPYHLLTRGLIHKNGGWALTDDGVQAYIASMRTAFGSRVGASSIEVLFPDGTVDRFVREESAGTEIVTTGHILEEKVT